MSQRTYYSDEARQEAQIKNTIIVAVCLALGATIGTVIAMLFAPQSGDETREQLEEASSSAFNRLQKQVDELRKQVEKLAS